MSIPRYNPPWRNVIQMPDDRPSIEVETPAPDEPKRDEED